MDENLCQARLVSYDRACGRTAGDLNELLGLWFCDKHFQQLIDQAVRLDERQREKDQLRGRLADDRVKALDRLRPTFRKLEVGTWEFYLRLPGCEGTPSRQVRKRGFARKLDAQRAAKTVVQELRSALWLDAQKYREAVDRLRTDAREYYSRLEQQVAAERAARFQTVEAARRDREKPRTVYYVRRPDGAIKIGTTWNLRTRMQAFRNVSPVELLAHHSGGQVAEAALHRRFGHLRRDGEWFDPGSDLLAHIEHVATCAEARTRAA